MFLLVAAIEGLNFNFDEHKHLPHAIHDTKRDFYHYYHMGKTTNPQHPETLKNKFSVIDSYGGVIGTDLGMYTE